MSGACQCVSDNISDLDQWKERQERNLQILEKMVAKALSFAAASNKV